MDLSVEHQVSTTIRFHRPSSNLRARSGFTVAVAALALAACIGVPDQDSRYPAPKYPHPPVAATRSTRPRYPTISVATLPSGLMVVLEQDFYAKTVGVVSVVRGGASADPAGAEGLAHLVEHLTFRAIDATPEVPPPLAGPGKSGARAPRRERLIHHAATLVNGLTSADALTFYEFAPPSQLPWLIDLEAARLSDPLAGIDASLVALERRSIASEHELRDDPRSGQWASRRIFPTLFPSGHPYARAVDGTSKSRSRLSLAEARTYAAESFRPERMTLLVSAPSGMTTLGAIVERLPKALVGDRSHPVARTPAAEGAEAEPVVSRSVQKLSSPLPVPQLWIGWTLPGLWGLQGASEALLARWVQQDLDLDYLRQEDPHIRQVRASLVPGVKATALMVRVLVSEGADPERITQIVAGRVESLWTREPRQHPLLERLKSLFDAELILDEPPQLDRAVAQAELIAFGARPIPFAEQMAKIHAIAPADLAKLAYKHLTQSHHHAVFYTPGDVASDTARPTGRSSNGGAGRSDSLFADAAGWDDMELPDAPAPVSNVVVKQLSTGLTVIVAKRASPSVTAWLAFRGGYADSDPPLLLEVALRTRPDANDAAKHGVLTDRGATRDASIEILEFRPSDMAPALDLLFKKATAPLQKWPTHDELDRMLAYVNADSDLASEQAAQAFYRALFGDHPLSRLVKKDDLARITRSDVDSWVGRVHNLRNAALVVVGDVRPEDVIKVATELSVKQGAPSWVEPIPSMAPLALKPAGVEHVAAVVTPRPGALTDIRLGCALPPMSPQDRTTYELLRLAIQERLSTAMRFERGEGYGVNVGLETLRGGIAFLSLSTYVNANELADALATLHTHWQRWGQGGFDAGEVKVARWLFAGQRALMPSMGNAIAYRLFSDWNQDAAGLLSGAANAFSGDVTTVDANRLNQLFASCKANAVLGLTGHEATIRQALRRSWPQSN